MAVASGSQQTFLPAYQENYLKDLLAGASALGTQGGMFIPEYKVAGMTPLQQQAIQMGAAGLGAYAPFFQSAANQMGAGAQTLGTGLGTIGQGAETVAGSTQAFDPSSVSQFMDPYTEQVIEQTQKDIGRLGDRQQQALKDRAVAAGAFGGGREAIGSAEIGRNVLDQQARTGAQLRSQGYQQAMGQAQSAFENQQRSQQQAALGQGQAQLGMGLQGAQQQDVQNLLGLGGLEQAQQQAQLDAYRQTIAERERSPYQNIGFLSDIFRGVPSTGGTFTQQYTPPPSMISQVAGLGLGLAGLGQAFPNMFSFGR